MIRSFLSFSFFRPPNAILVPGMYFLGFSRYSNYRLETQVSRAFSVIRCQPLNALASREKSGDGTYQSVLLPLNTLLLVGVGVRVALNGAGVTAEQAVQSRADLVATAGLNGVALSATGLEEVGTLLRVAYRWELAVILLRRCF